MDPVTSLAVKAVDNLSEAATKQAEGFLTTVLLAPLEAFGGLLADKINARRHANLIIITLGATERLKNAGVSPRAVPLSIIHPAIEAASLEEEPSLQETWANMLANAANPREPNIVLPSFPVILKELTAGHVKFLDALFMETQEKLKSRLHPYWPKTVAYTFDDLQSLYKDAGLAAAPGSGDEAKEANRRSLSLCMDVLMRHQLLETSFQIDEVRFEMGGPDLRISYSLTDLAMCFIEACRPPMPSPDKPSHP